MLYTLTYVHESDRSFELEDNFEGFHWSQFI